MENNFPSLLALAAMAYPELTEGMILLDDQKQILHCSESTRQLLANFFPADSDDLNRLPRELEERLDDPSSPTFKKIRQHQALEINFFRDKISGRYLLTTRARDAQTAICQLGALGLTPRETEVLYWIAEGKRDQEIAVILTLSIHTVKTHVKNILRRLEVETRTAAAMAAMPFIKK